MSLLLPHKEHISVEEYYDLRHTLLSLRRQYAHAVYTNDQSQSPTKKLKRLQRNIQAIEHQLAYSDIDFPIETLTLRGLVSELREKIRHTNLRLRQHLMTLKQALAKPRARFEA